MVAEKLPGLHKLISIEEIALLLRDFGPLLGTDVSLALCDGAGQVLGSSRPVEDEVACTLLEMRRDAGDVVVGSEGAAVGICCEGRPVGVVLACGQVPSTSHAQAVLRALKCAIENLINAALERRAVARETLDRYREINLLYRLGETLATCLDVDELVQRALVEASKIIQARRGAVMLCEEDGSLTPVAHIGISGDQDVAISGGLALAEEVAWSGKSRILNDLVEGEQPVPLLGVPLRTAERQLGVILLADKIGAAMFTAGDEKLLAALAWQAAIALENARLFDNVRRQRDEIATMKNYMDNTFASIASGVVTTDMRDVITTFNHAAEEMLGIPAHLAVGHPYQDVLPFLCDTSLPALVESVRQGGACVAQEISPSSCEGGELHLSCNLSTLRGSGGEALGVAIVIDDVTAKRRYEREHGLVRRYLPPELVDRLPHDLAELGLHGERRTITVMFVDVRGFTKFSEVHSPERVVEVLNSYLTLAESAVRAHRGIVDKYMGDAVMALFNTPLVEEEQHAWRAVQAALAIKEAVEAHSREISPEERLFVGIGVCTGEAVVGNVGAEDRMEYTAIGNPVNVAFHLQGSAQAGQVLLCDTAWALVRDKVRVNPLPAVRVKGRRKPTGIYELVGLKDE